MPGIDLDDGPHLSLSCHGQPRKEPGLPWTDRPLSSPTIVTSQAQGASALKEYGLQGQRVSGPEGCRKQGVAGTGSNGNDRPGGGLAT